MISVINEDADIFEKEQGVRGKEASKKVAERIRRKKLDISGDSRKKAEEFAASQQTQLVPMTAATSLAPLDRPPKNAWGQ